MNEKKTMTKEILLKNAKRWNEINKCEKKKLNFSYDFEKKIMRGVSELNKYSRKILEYDKKWKENYNNKGKVFSDEENKEIDTVYAEYSILHRTMNYFVTDDAMKVLICAEQSEIFVDDVEKSNENDIIEIESVASGVIGDIGGYCEELTGFKIKIGSDEYFVERNYYTGTYNIIITSEPDPLDYKIIN